MKKSLSVFVLITSIAFAATSCESSSMTAEKTADTNFLTVPAEPSGCGVELCFCEHAKQHFSIAGR